MTGTSRMLLDTSGLLCCFDRAEARHLEATGFLEATDACLTHSYVLAEFVALCQARGLDRARSLSFTADLTDNPLVEVVWVDEVLHRAALNFLQARLDKTYSLCDAVSFLVMRARGLTEALTTDHHFSQAGYRPLLRSSR